MKKLFRCKAAIVLPDFAVIGAQRVALDYGKQLDKINYDVHWICGDKKHPADPELVVEKVHFFNSTLFQGLRGVRVIERFIRLALHLRKNEYDVILSVTPLLNRVLCIFKLTRIIKSRLVIEDHAYPPRSYADEFPRRAVQLFYKYTEALYTNASILRTLTEDCRNYYTEGNKKINAVSFPNLMDFTRIERLRHRNIAELHAPDLVYIGRFETQKNISFLLECFAELVKRHNNIRLSIIGYGQQESLLKEKAGLLRIEDNVSFCHSGPDNYALLSRAKVFPLTSLWEGFPLVLIEAMYLGVAVDSVNCKTGPKELIGEDRSRGWLVPENDKAAFVNAVLGALENPIEYKEKTNRASRHVREYLNIDTRFGEYVDIFLRGDSSGVSSNTDGCA